MGNLWFAGLFRAPSALNVLDFWWICVEWLDEVPMRQCILCLGWVWQSLQISESEILKDGPSVYLCFICVYQVLQMILTSSQIWACTHLCGPNNMDDLTEILNSRSWIRDFPVVQWLSIRLPVQGTRFDSWCRIKISPCIAAIKSECSGACVSQLRPEIARK